MSYPDNRYKGKSFLWAFLLFLGLFTCAIFWGRALGLGRNTAAVLIGVSGFIPLAIQLATGYGLDSTWTARFGPKEDPFMYWVTLAVSVFVGAFFAFCAVKMWAG